MVDLARVDPGVIWSTDRAGATAATCSIAWRRTVLVEDSIASAAGVSQSAMTQLGSAAEQGRLVARLRDSRDDGDPRVDHHRGASCSSPTCPTTTRAVVVGLWPGCRRRHRGVAARCTVAIPIIRQLCAAITSNRSPPTRWPSRRWVDPHSDRRSKRDNYQGISTGPSELAKGRAIYARRLAELCSLGSRGRECPRPAQRSPARQRLADAGGDR